MEVRDIQIRDILKSCTKDRNESRQCKDIDRYRYKDLGPGIRDIDPIEEQETAIETTKE